MKIIHFLVLLFCFCFSDVTSQLTITGYSTFAIGAETKLYKNLHGEFRIYTNEILDETSMEVQFYHGFKSAKYHQIRIGAGINGNLFLGEVYSLQVPLQLHIFPFQDFKRLAFVIEFAPQWTIGNVLGTDTLILRNLWGVRYSFGKD